jgi:hypothetical protein
MKKIDEADFSIISPDNIITKEDQGENLKDKVDEIIKIITDFVTFTYTQGTIDVLKYTKEFIYDICKY